MLSHRCVRRRATTNVVPATKRKRTETTNTGFADAQQLQQLDEGLCAAAPDIAYQKPIHMGGPRRSSRLKRGDRKILHLISREMRRLRSEIQTTLIELNEERMTRGNVDDGSDEVEDMSMTPDIAIDVSDEADEEMPHGMHEGDSDASQTDEEGEEDDSSDCADNPGKISFMKRRRLIQYVYEALGAEPEFKQ